MKLRLLLIWNRLQESYWFIPGVFSLVAIAMSIAAPLIEKAYTDGTMSALTAMVSIDAGSARLLLSVITGSSMTVIGVVFSILIAVLANASTQFGPGLLPRFMRLKSTQVTLGIFLACFIYSMGVFTQLEDRTSIESSGPILSVLMGIMLAIISFIVLIHFIHCITQFLQPLSIINSIADDLTRTLCMAYPEPNNNQIQTSAEGYASLRERIDIEDVTTVVSPRSGYLQAVEFQQLEKIIEDEMISVDLCAHPGSFLLEGDTLAHFVANAKVGDRVNNKLQGVFVIGERRDSMQDPDYAMEQLVEIAVRALSPGVNAPFLAFQCMNQICAALVLVAGRSQPQRVNIISKNFWVRNWYGYDVLCDSAFNLLRQYGDACEEILLRLLHIIEKALDEDIDPAYRKVLLSHAALINERAEIVFKQDAVRDVIRNKYEDLCF